MYNGCISAVLGILLAVNAKHVTPVLRTGETVTGMEHVPAPVNVFVNLDTPALPVLNVIP